MEVDVIYDFFAWYLRRRWMVRRIICSQTLKDNMKFLQNMLAARMIKEGSNQHYDFIHMMRIYSK